jgi:hypothetical protein
VEMPFFVPRPFDRLRVQQVLLSPIAKRLNPATVLMLRPDRPGLQPTDKTGLCLRFQHENAVRNAHEQIDLHRVRAIRQNDVARHRPSERAHLARDQCPSTRTDRSSKVRILGEHARRAKRRWLPSVATTRPRSKCRASVPRRSESAPPRRRQQALQGSAGLGRDRRAPSCARLPKRQAPGDHAAS